MFKRQSTIQRELLILTQLILASLSLGNNSSDNGQQHCRDRLGYFLTDDYKISTCTLCYFYLVLSNPAYTLNTEPQFRQNHDKPYCLVRELHHNGVNSVSDNVCPTLDDLTAIETVCETLGDDDCTRWRSCCQAAWDCCLQQLDNTVSTVNKPTNDSVCPQTFDGWTCWDYALANTVSTRPCPEFLTYGNTDTTGRKTCRADGTWEVSTITGLEQTNYEGCTATNDFQVQRTAITVGTVLNISGSLMLVPALLIFIRSRTWRKQQRIKIHTNLFMSVLLSSVLNVVWDICVRQDRVNHTASDSFLHQQQVLCKTMFVVHQYLKATTFFWMTCESFFLHRLLVNAFLPPKRFYGYVLFGWGLPAVVYAIYSGVRKTIADDSVCWILPLDGSARVLDWLLVFAPAAACLLANLVIFGTIMKLMMSKLIIHPDDPGKFRRALRATCLLIPLFGLYLFCFMYRPKVTDGHGYDVYEIFSAIVLNSQGILVSILLFYGNGEVQTHLKSILSEWRRRHICRNGEDRKLSVSMGTGTCTSRRTSVSSLQNIEVSDKLETGESFTSLRNEVKHSKEVQITKF